MSTINDLIEFESESSNLDFKLTQYRKESYVSLLKDAISMANGYNKDIKYIIIGLKPRNQDRNIQGLLEDLVDSATYQQLIYENVEPEINLEYTSHQFNGKTMGVFKISDCDNPPYLMKKDYNNANQSLKKGDGFIRKGTTQMKLCRGDYDVFYGNKHNSKASIWLNDNNSIIEDIIYFQQKVIHYVQKPLIKSQFEILAEQLVKHKPLFSYRQLVQRKVNRSLYELNFKLTNDGQTPLEKVKIYFDLEGNHLETLEYNTVERQEGIAGILNGRKSHLKINNCNSIVSNLNDSIVLGTDNYFFKKVYLRVDKKLITNINIKWKLLSKSLITNGVIRLVITPKIKTVREFNYVESLLSVRKEYLPIEDCIDEVD